MRRAHRRRGTGRADARDRSGVARYRRHRVADARPEFTLLRFDSAVDVTAFECAARRRATLLKILDVERPDPAIFYGGALVLSRPDQHVAWRGDCLPADPLALIDRIRGAAN